MKKLSVMFALFAFVVFTTLAQTVQITGTVTSSEDGGTIPGASVVVKGTTIGVTTDFDGKYSINVPEGSEILEFSYVGMRKQEVEIGGRSVVDVVMEPDLLNLDEVVVTAIGIKRETKALGYGVQNVESDELTKAANQEVINSLAGKVAGVQITSTSGSAGASAYIQIRGAASITRNNQPLWIVDGSPIYSGGGGMGVSGWNQSSRTIDINPDDIESMTVLKGGAATALYGLQAANGAIVITTKRGSASKRIHVNITSSATIKTISMMPGRQKTYSQGSQGVWNGPSTGQGASWGARIDELVYDGSDYKWDPYGQLIPKEGAPAGSRPAQYYDPYEYFDTGTQFANSVSLTGGSEEATFYMSIGNSTEDGVVPNNTFDKTTFKLTGDAKLHEKFSVSGSINYANTYGNRIGGGSNVSGVMLGLFRTATTFDNSAGYMFPDGTQRNYRGGGGYDNPYWVSYNIAYQDRTNRMYGNIGFNWDPLPWLNVTYRLGTDWYDRQVKTFYAKYSRGSSQGSDSEDHDFNQLINSDLLVNMSKSFGDNLNLKATIGHNMYQTAGRGVSAWVNNLDIPGFYQVSNSAAISANEGRSKRRTAAIFGDVGVEWMDMVFANVTLRNEWSTTLPEGANSFMYPSFNGSFIFTELPVLKDNAILSFGKLRASYAITANDAAASSTYTPFFKSGAGDGWTSGINFPMMGYSGFTLGGTVGNTNIKPETQTTFEVGADLRFFLNRFGVDISYFRSINTDLLLSVPVAPSSGFGSSYQNAAEMETYGWEFVLSATPVTGTFTWDILVNWSNPYSFVNKLAPGVEVVGLGGFTDPSVRAVAGQPYRSVYSTIFETNEDGQWIIDDDPTSTNYGFPIDAGESGPAGNIMEDWRAGITNSFSFKGLTASFLIDIKKGGLMYNGTRAAMQYFGTHEFTEDREDNQGWIAEGVKESDGSPNDIVVNRNQWWYFYGPNSNFSGPSSPFVEPSDWIKLRELTLSYSVPGSLLDRTFIKKLDVFFTGTNLWIATPYTGIDPETSLTGTNNGQGFDYFNQPGTRNYTFGLKLAF
ncbi:MAG: SusC/RagA family TonB-linked outer membrane protein [Marinilabiliaceae bacterium]|jgi:TonB-linked SusC/RagA family outer membrane protein|nr:SusC/RagA family TonB-linked outer membrane protein [Marinilabiliaceae bacterium]